MKDKQEQEGLEKLIDEVLNASSINREEVNRIAESPFLYSRLRVRIKEEEKLRNETGGFWNELFLSFKFAAKVMAVLALIAISFFILQPLPPKAYVGEDQASVEQTQSQIMDVAELSNEELFQETIGMQNDVKLPDEVK